VKAVVLGAIVFLGARTSAQASERARDLAIPIGGRAGPIDAITDVAGVTVGHVTIVRGNGKLVVGTGPVRTGVTAVLPRGANDPDPVFAAFATLTIAAFAALTIAAFTACRRF